MNMLSPVKAIRCKCLDCMGYQPKQVKLCDDVECPLHPYRFGKNPNRKGVGKKKVVSEKKLLE